MVVDSDLLSLYTITGLNVLHLRASPDGGDSFSDTTTGFNLGAGAELDLGFGRAFGEAKYVLGSDRDEQLVLGAGIRSEEHTSELQSRGQLVCRLLLEKNK